MANVRPLRDVFADLAGEPGTDTPSDVLAANGHPDLSDGLVAEAVVNYADTAPIEVAQHLAPFVMAHSPVPVVSGYDDDAPTWLAALSSAPVPDEIDPAAVLDLGQDHGLDPAVAGDQGRGLSADASHALGPGHVLDPGHTVDPGHGLDPGFGHGDRPGDQPADRLGDGASGEAGARHPGSAEGLPGADDLHLYAGHLDPTHLDPSYLDPGHLDPSHLDPSHLDAAAFGDPVDDDGSGDDGEAGHAGAPDGIEHH